MSKATSAKASHSKTSQYSSKQILKQSQGHRWWSRALALSAFTLVPMTGYVLLPTAATAQTMISYPQPERTISVTGQGSYAIPTTLTQVNLGVLVEAPTAEAAQQQAAQQSSAVVEWVRSQNVDNLQTTGISLYPQYNYVDDRQVLRGYQATNSISFRTATDRAGAIIDEAVRVGATQIDGVSFVAEDEAVAEARQRALELAVQDAQRQADTVLAALGLSRQEVLNISIGSMNVPPPSPLAQNARLTSADEAAKTPIIGQEQTVMADVTLQIRY
jgi:uncharacterized protein